jgi:hypothetical protein
MFIDIEETKHGNQREEREKKEKNELVTGAQLPPHAALE